MDIRFGNGRLVWTTLAVAWTIAVMSVGWINLPRAQFMAHTPDFLDKLSVETFAAVSPGAGAVKKAARGALIWIEKPRRVRMLNGVDLEFPPNTTGMQAASVASEYRNLLDRRADEMRRPYLLALLALWLLPCWGFIAGGPALMRLLRQPASQPTNSFEPYVRQRTETVAPAADHGCNEDVSAIATTVVVRPDDIFSGYRCCVHEIRKQDAASPDSRTTLIFNQPQGTGYELGSH